MLERPGCSCSRSDVDRRWCATPLEKRRRVGLAVDASEVTEIDDFSFTGELDSEASATSKYGASARGPTR